MAVTEVITGRNVESSYENVLETFPKSISPTGGTVSTGSRNDQIVGSGTSFNTDLEKSDYIWFTTTNELMEVRNVVDDENLTLYREVSGTLSGVSFKIVKKNSFKSISWLLDSVGTAEINSIIYPISSSKTYGNSKPNGQGGGNRLSPLLINTTTNSNIVYVSGE